MPINFGNVGISGIVCTNASSILADVSGVAITNDAGQLVGIISLPRNFTKLKSEGSRIVGFNITGIRDELLLPFTKSTSGEDLIFNRSDIVDFISYEPDGLVIESNEYSIDLDSNEPVNFKFYYPFNQAKFAPDKTLIASNISSLLYFLQQQDADAPTKIQNAFNFNINDFISPSGNDISIASGAANQAIEASKRISVLVQATTTSVQGVSELDCFQALATNVASETTSRSGVQAFFEEKSSGIILATIASVSGLASIEELPQEVINQTINLADNINYISNKDIENYDRGNEISSLVLLQNLLQQGIDLKADNTTVATAINEQVETIASGILGEDYVIPPTTTTTTTTTTTMAEPIFDQFFSNVALLLHMDGNLSTFTDSSSTPKTVNAIGTATQSTTQSRWGGKSGYFGGNRDRLTIPDAASFYFGSGDYVVEAWLYIPSLNIDGGGYFFSQAANLSNNNNRQYAFNANSTGLTVYFTTNGVSDNFYSFPATIPTNQWFHVAFSRSSQMLSAYLNGQRIGEPISDNATYYNSSANVCVGSFGEYANNGYEYLDFTGFIDDLRVTTGSNRGYVGATITVPTAAFPDSGPPTTTTTTTTTTADPTIGDPLFSSVSLLLHMDASPFVDSSANDVEIESNSVSADTSIKRFGNASMQGNSSYLSILDASALDFGNYGTFTIEMWYRRSESQWDSDTLYQTFTNTGSFAGHIVAVTTLGQLVVYERERYVVENVTAFPNTNQWYHFAISVQDGALSAYVDGALVATGSFTEMGGIGTRSTDRNWIGGNIYGGRLAGWIDEFRVTKNHARNITVPTAPYPDFGPTTTTTTTTTAAPTTTTTTTTTTAAPIASLAIISGSAQGIGTSGSPYLVTSNTSPSPVYQANTPGILTVNFTSIRTQSYNCGKSGCNTGRLNESVYFDRNDGNFYEQIRTNIDNTTASTSFGGEALLTNSSRNTLTTISYPMHKGQKLRMSQHSSLAEDDRSASDSNRQLDNARISFTPMNNPSFSISYVGTRGVIGDGTPSNPYVSSTNFSSNPNERTHSFRANGDGIIALFGWRFDGLVNNVVPLNTNSTSRIYVGGSANSFSGARALNKLDMFNFTQNPYNSITRPVSRFNLLKVTDGQIFSFAEIASNKSSSWIQEISVGNGYRPIFCCVPNSASDLGIWLMNTRVSIIQTSWQPSNTWSGQGTQASPANMNFFTPLQNTDGGAGNMANIYLTMDGTISFNYEITNGVPLTVFKTLAPGVYGGPNAGNVTLSTLTNSSGSLTLNVKAFNGINFYGEGYYGKSGQRMSVFKITNLVFTPS